ncbi:hypothetical protein VTH06DRAFT_2781 [Thermothelomyces fergusii]
MPIPLYHITALELQGGP